MYGLYARSEWTFHISVHCESQFEMHLDQSFSELFILIDPEIRSKKKILKMKKMFRMLIQQKKLTTILILSVEATQMTSLVGQQQATKRYII